MEQFKDVNRRKSKHKEKLNIAMFGQKRIPSREGGVEIVVEELCSRMVAQGHNVTCYNRGGHHVSGSEYDSKRLKEYKGIRLKTVPTIEKHYAFIKKMVDGGIQQVAVMGSMHEIGFFEGSINESTPCHPSTPYGIGKNALRDLTQMICKQKNIVFQWLRGYYIVGNSKFGSSIFSKITAAVDEGKTEFPFTLGQNQYDFIDYPDFCAQVAAVVGQKNEQGIINICSGKPEKLADRVERFIKENDYRIKLQYGAFPDRPYDSKAIWGNDTKIRKIMENQTN